MVRTRTVRLAGLVLVAGLVLSMTACDPVSHPTFTTVEPNTGPVTLRGLSSDGNYALVRADAAGATVPGPGFWRVDRRDGTAVALPASFQNMVGTLSSDGHRYSYYDPVTYETRIWIDGTIVTPPSFTALSRDLRWAVFFDPFIGHARRWSVDTQTHIDVEAGHPRPAEFPNFDGQRGPWGVSDDGEIVWFTLVGTSGCMTRFIFVSFGEVRDFPYCSMTVAANGSSFVRQLDVVESSNPLVPLGGPTRLELVQTWSAQTVRVLQPTIAGAWFDGVRLDPFGWVLWAVETTVQGTAPPGCGGMGQPLCTGTITAHHAFAASATELATFAVEPGLSRGDKVQSAVFTVSLGGRWLVYSTGAPGGAVHVLDRITGFEEQLVGNAGRGKFVPAISADGGVVAYTETYPGSTSNGFYGTGWFEHEVAPVGP